MPLRVVAGPGCDAVGKDEFVEDELQPGDVVISVGRIFKALTATTDVPKLESAPRSAWRCTCGQRRSGKRARSGS